MSGLVVSLHFDNADVDAGADEGARIEARLLRFMCAAVVVAAGASLFVFAWRVTAGLLLGGVLAIVNYSWVRSSVRAAFAPVVMTDEGTGEVMNVRPRWGVWRYAVRYFVVAGLVGVAYTLDLVSLVAVLCGLCAFAAAGMLEGLVQLYFAVINRKDA